MRKFRPVLLLLFLSCQSQPLDPAVEYTIYQPVSLEWSETPQEYTQWPKAEFHYSFYSPVTISSIPESDHAPWPRVEFIEDSEPAEEEIILAATSNSPEPIVEPEPPPEPAPDPPPQPAPAPASPAERHLSSLDFSSMIGLDPEITLPGGGWEFISSQSSLAAPREDRLNWQQSVYIFDNPGEGRHNVVFRKQDHTTGGWIYQNCFLVIEAAPIEVVELPEENAEEPRVEENPVSDESPQDLRNYLQVELRNGAADKRIETLEKLLEFEWSGEEKAEFYYLLARELERHGVTQDLQRAYGLYEKIETEFFLTSFYSPALERIQFLDQNFFHLQ